MAFEANVPTIEERLLATLEQTSLLAELFEFMAVAGGHVDPRALSTAALSAMSRMCRQASVDIRTVVDCLPAPILNSVPKPPRR
jgi:hypothetical protein